MDMEFIRKFMGAWPAIGFLQTEALALLRAVLIPVLSPPVHQSYSLWQGCGGFSREQATGTAGFTPALPLLREQLVAIRAAIGLLQMTALALVPAGVLPALSRLAHESHALLQ